MALSLLGAKSARDVAIPVELRGGRFFAIPRTRDGRTFACWLDTNGSGFVFDSAVERFRLSTAAMKGRRVAALPSFADSANIPPLQGGNALPVFERGSEDKTDPILQGFEGQLGRSWFAGRVWLLDFRHARVTMLAHPLARTSRSIALEFERGSPYLGVRAADDRESLKMSFDIAASAAFAAGVRATSFVRRALFERWHRTHPGWKIERSVSTTPDVDLIVVPRVRVGTVSFANVAFTTRPHDDVFENTLVDGKLGANAYANAVVGIDYSAARLNLEVAPD